MRPRDTEQEIRDLRRGSDRGLGEEGRTKEEQDRAMDGGQEQVRPAEDGSARDPAGKGSVRDRSDDEPDGR